MPDVGTTIFTVMSQMANAHHAINLSQGFPEFPVAEELIDLVHRNMQMGHNQYAPMAGLPKLNEAIAEKIYHLYGRQVNPASDITVTCGASEAIFSAISALVQSGEEVVVLEPAYDCYIPAVTLAGGIVKTVPLDVQHNFAPDWPAIKQAVNANTRLLIINTPHNPTGAVLEAHDLDALKELLQNYPDLMVLSDEVYEHIMFDGKKHLSVLSDEFLTQRCIAVYSFGKTFHATGWKVGYVVAPEEITKEIRKVHQYNCYAIHTPTQYALAAYLNDEAHYTGLSTMYEQKRDFFAKAMAPSRFKAVPCAGSYFQLFDYSSITDAHDKEFATELTKEHGVASIPVSAFYKQGTDHKLLRFCFAKGEETLAKAAEILCKI